MPAMTVTLPREEWMNFVNGDWTTGSGGAIDVLDPATGEVVAQQALATGADIDDAVKAAWTCHLSGALRDLEPVERGRLVQGIGRYLLDHLDEIAGVLCIDAGKPLWEAKDEVRTATRLFEFFGNLADSIEGQSIPLGPDYFDFTVNEPYGVTAHIIPWNFPLETIARSVAPALVAGNTCVVKTPELDPMAAHYLGAAAQHVGLPAGALNLLCGRGPEAGAALSAHAEIAQIVFTGSVPTGIAVATAAARNVVPCLLELGGKSAGVVFEDADLDTVVDDVRRGTFYNAGQVCSALARLVVHRSIHDEVVAKVVAMAESLRVDSGIVLGDPGASMAALISAGQRDKVEAMCRRARQDGATIATGGTRRDRAGYFFAPTVITDVTPDLEIAQHEVFGPVLAVIPFETEDEAIAIANGTQYGLVAGVYTADVHRAMHASRELWAGQVFVNEWFAGSVATPFGGYGKSGYGREKGRQAISNYVQTKNIAVAFRDRP